LKAKFCRLGCQEIKTILTKNGFPYNELGKLIVAKNADDLENLEKLFHRGVSNGVDLEIHDVSRLSKFESKARTFEKFLWSPTTAVSDPSFLTKSLLKEFLKAGGKVEYDTQVELRESSDEVRLKDSKFHFKYVVNAAGPGALKLAKQVGVGSEYSLIPFRGTYWVASNDNLRLSKLVYPVPHKLNPFLGVHFTNTIDGQLKLGPTALPVLSAESYDFALTGNLADLRETLFGWSRIVRGDSHSVKSLIASEVKRLSLRNIISEASDLVPEVKKISSWAKKNSGVRSQLVHNTSGELIQDFIVSTKANSVHVLNVVSPGWTSSIPFARWIVETYLTN
jgi:L-2-hydroxyglutarate oxidase LhgO